METMNLALSKRRYLKNFMFYGLFNAAISIMWGAYNNYFPIILQAGRPDFKTTGAGIAGFGLSAFVTGLIMSIDNVMGVVGGPIFGAMGDKSLKRKEVGGTLGMLCALFFAAIPTIAKIVTPESSGRTMALLMPLVLITVAAFLTILTDCFGASYRSGYQFTTVPKAHHNTMSSFSVAFGGVGYLVATLASSYLYTLDHAYPFYLGAIIELFVSFAFLTMMPPETDKNERVREELARAGIKRANPLKTIKTAFAALSVKARISIGLILLMKGLGSFGIVGLQTYASSWMLNKHGIQPNLAALMSAAYFLSYMACAIPIGLIADKINKTKAFALALIISGLSGILFLSIGNTIPVISGLAVFLAISGSLLDVITLPYVVSLVPSEQNATGTIFSVTLSSMVVLTIINVPLLGAIIDWTKNYDVLFYAMILTSLLAVVPLYFLNKFNARKTAA